LIVFFITEKVTSNNKSNQQSSFFNELSSHRRPMAITAMKSYAVAAPKGTIALSVGTPNADGYPFADMKVGLRDGQTFSFNSKIYLI